MENEQIRIYEMLEKLQTMARDVPMNIQQRLSNELLSSLASALVQGQIFEIVQMLQEVQHGTEKQLFNQRLDFRRQLQDEKAEFERKYEELMNNAKSDMDVISIGSRQAEEKEQMSARHQKEQKKFDTSLILQIDKQVIDQQVTLEKAGVPGFYVTNNPIEIQVQMHLLKFMMNLKDLRESS